MTNPFDPSRSDTVRAAAVRGHVAAQLVLGQLLLDGAHGVPRDPRQAVRWFRIAAGADFAPACNMLGRCLENGWGTERNLGEAARWYRAAAAAADDWGRYNLANMLLRGRGVPQDPREAWTLFHAAAEAGHAKSMNLVARFLEEGWDRPRDQGAALAWYRRSAEAGDYRGCHNLATWLAERGRLAEALAWWRQALPDATADILREMAAILPALGPEAAPLVQDARSRLERLETPSTRDARLGRPVGIVRPLDRLARWCRTRAARR